MPGIPQIELDECRCCSYTAQNSRSYQGSVPSTQLALVPLADCCVHHTCSNTQRLVTHKPPVAMHVVKLHTCSTTQRLVSHKPSGYTPVAMQVGKLHTLSSCIHL